MTERPQSVSTWLKTRLPILSAFRREYVEFAMPRNLNYLWNFGAFAVVSLTLLILSGIFLALNYTPTLADAFSSVETIDRQVASGWLIRSIHMGGVSMLFAALYVHIARSLYYGSYKAPRELVWLTGLGLLLLVMITAFAGYVLPWGQMSYWGATVVVNAVNTVPLVGKPLASWLLGGEGLGNVALHRPFVILNATYLNKLVFHQLAEQLSIEPQVLFESDNSTLISGLVRENLALAFISDIATPPDDDLIEIPIEDVQVPSVHINLIRRAHQFPIGLFKQVMDIVEQTFNDDAAQVKG